MPPHDRPSPAEPAAAVSTGGPARRRLLTGPAGSGKTARAMEAIRAAATRPGPRGRGAAAPGQALLVLPTYAQVMHVKRRALSRWETRGILDEPFATFTSAGERFLPGFQVRGLPSAEERDRLMEEALRARDVPLFHDIADRPGFRAKLLRLIKELKQTGLAGTDCRARMRAAHDDGDAGLSGGARARLAGFLEVFAAYEGLLERAGLEDHEDALRRLADALAEGREHVQPPPALLVVDGFDDFTAVEERILFRLADLVEAAGGETLITLPWDPDRPELFEGSAGIRRRLRARGFEEEQARGFRRSDDPALQRLATSLFGSGGAAPLPAGPAVQWLVAGDAQDEAETLARTVRALVTRTGDADDDIEDLRGWRDVGIVLRQHGPTTRRIVSACERLGVPLRVLGGGETLSTAPILRALRGPLRVLGGRVEAGRFRAADLMEWLRWRAASRPQSWTVSDLDDWEMVQRAHGVPPDYEAFCRRAPEALRPALEEITALRAQLQAAPAAPDRYDGLAAAIDTLVPLPAPSGFDETGRPRDLAHDGRVQHAAAALARVRTILQGLRAAVDRTGLGGAPDLTTAVHELEEAMERTTLRLPDRRLDAVTLLDAEEARYWELPVVFVAGLEEGSMPLRPRQDLILRDADRRALRSEAAVEQGRAVHLPLAREKEGRERRLFYGAVTRARRRLYLSRRGFDDKGEPRGASSFVRDLEREVTPQRSVEAPAPGRVLQPLARCFTRADLGLWSAARLSHWSAERGNVPAGDRALAVALQEALGSTARRRAGACTRRRPDALWSDPAAEGAVLRRFRAATEEVSVSRLNRAVACPQQFFLAYVAEVPTDDLTLDGPVFDARAQGSALHHAFDLALRDPERSAAEAAAAGVAKVEARGLDAKLLTVELERAVTLLRLRQKETAGPLQPWIEGLELDFTKKRAVPFGPSDCRYHLGGFIDRIDRTAAGDASILDYKRSASSAESAWKRAKDGADLQLPLYALAVEALTDLRVRGLEWVAGLTRSRRILCDADAGALFASRREAQAPLVEEHDAFRARLHAAEATATDAVRRMRDGSDERRPLDPALCATCDWLRVCRPDRAWIQREADARAAGEEEA